MNRTEREFWRGLDEFTYGSNDPRVLKDKMLRMKAQLEQQRSSLGRFLESLRRELKLSLKEMALKAKVELPLWKDWEMDFATPSREELERVICLMKWTPYRQEILWKLWGEASLFRLKRLTAFRPELLAARGVASESGLAWQSVGEENQQLLLAWAEKHGFDFPGQLIEFLTSLENDEARKSWVEEVLGL